MGRWDQHVRSWADQTQLPVLIMRYEDMLANGSETFTKLATFLGLPDDADLIDQALENTSIEKLKKLEEDVDGFDENLQVVNDSFAQDVQEKEQSSFQMSSENDSPRDYLRS